MCVEVFGEKDPVPFCLPLRAALAKGADRFESTPRGEQRDSSRSSVSVLMTSLLGQTRFC